MRRLALTVGVAIAASCAGCYSTEPIRDLNRSNRDYLERMVIKLSLTADQARQYEALADEERPAFIARSAEANLAELRGLFTDASALRAQLALDQSATPSPNTTSSRPTR